MADAALLGTVSSLPWPWPPSHCDRLEEPASHWGCSFPKDLNCRRLDLPRVVRPGLARERPFLGLNTLPGGRCPAPCPSAPPVTGSELDQGWL